MNIYERIAKIERIVKRLAARTSVLYDKGSLTLTLAGATTPGVTTYTNQVGAYVRLGALMVVAGRITWTAVTGTGIAVYGGLPQASRNTAALRYPAALWMSAVTFGGAFVQTLMAENATVFTLYTSTSNVAATQLNIEAAGDVAFVLVYFL